MTNKLPLHMPNRRHFIGLAAASITATAIAVPAHATEVGAAQKVVQDMVTYLDRSVVRVKNADAAAEAFEEAFRTFADIYFLGSYALGVAGRGASKAEKTKFSEAFVGYLSRKYARRFTDFTGPRIEVKSATAARKFVQVNARASIASGQAVNLEFHVSDRSGSPKVINIFIEGVNVLLAERSEVLALLDANGGSISKLTKDIETR